MQCRYFVQARHSSTTVRAVQGQCWDEGESLDRLTSSERNFPNRDADGERFRTRRREERPCDRSEDDTENSTRRGHPQPGLSRRGRADESDANRDAAAKIQRVQKRSRVERWRDTHLLEDDERGVVGVETPNTRVDSSNFSLAASFSFGRKERSGITVHDLIKGVVGGSGCVSM
jgi:hypothetical protein